MENKKHSEEPSADILKLASRSKVKLLEKTLFRFFEQFQDSILKIYKNETDAFQHIHQLDNHLDQIRICQKVIIKELPPNLDIRLKDRLLTKLYWKILHYIRKLRCIVEWYKKEIEVISSLSFECIRVANEIPPTFIPLYVPEEKETQITDSKNQANEVGLVDNNVDFCDILRPTVNRLSLVQLLEWTSQLNIMLSEYVDKMEDGLDGLAQPSTCAKPEMYGIQRSLDKHIETDKRSQDLAIESLEGGQYIEWIGELFAFPEKELEDIGEECSEFSASYNKGTTNKQENEIGRLAFMVLKQNVSDATLEHAHDKSAEDIQYETKQGKQLKDAFTFPFRYKIDIQQILFETSFFLNTFKCSKGSRNKQQVSNISGMISPTKSLVPGDIVEGTPQNRNEHDQRLRNVPIISSERSGSNKKLSSKSKRNKFDIYIVYHAHYWVQFRETAR